MKEDLAIARNSLLALQAENLALRRTAQQGNTDVRNENTSNVLDQIDPEVAQALATEKKKRLDVERELELQVLHLFPLFFCFRYYFHFASQRINNSISKIK